MLASSGLCGVYSCKRKGNNAEGCAQKPTSNKSEAHLTGVIPATRSNSQKEF